MLQNGRSPLISICIPAYKRVEKNCRLLQSIAIQQFRDFEVVITDDSPDDSVKNLVAEFGDLPIVYFKNPVSLGTPANWNFCISKARGTWIKIMHDDDWFADENSLQVFADHTGQGKKFIISRYLNVNEEGKNSVPRFPGSWKEKIIKEPLFLLSENVIGPPSVTLVHHSIKEVYDERMKWRVDMDYYIRLLKQERDFELIATPVVKVGISESQVTNSCINMPEVELPEGLLMLNKYGTSPLRHIRIYDAWWRILRNVGANMKRLEQFGGQANWPSVIRAMVLTQQKLPTWSLQAGILSKIAMSLSYLSNRNKL